MFTVEQRDRVCKRVLDLAMTDPRVTAGALTGSGAVGAEDKWSNIDLAFGVTDSINPEAVLHDWTEVLDREFGALDHFDLHSWSSIYRVFLLAHGLEVDVAVTPQHEFRVCGPEFRVLFGQTRQLEPAPRPDAHYLIFGEAAGYGRGLDRLPAPVTGPLADALVCSLDESELRRALPVATACLIGEVEPWNRALCI